MKELSFHTDLETNDDARTRVDVGNVSLRRKCIDSRRCQICDDTRVVHYFFQELFVISAVWAHSVLQKLMLYLSQSQPAVDVLILVHAL